MEPRPVTEKDLSFWNGFRRTFKCPPGMENCRDVEVIHCAAPDLIRIPWQPNEIELADLATGGTVWLTIWGGGMSPVDIQVTGKITDE